MSHIFFDLLKQEGVISLPSPLNPAEAPLKMHFFAVNPIRELEMVGDIKAGKKSLTDAFTDLMCDSWGKNGQAEFLGVYSALSSTAPLP